MTHFRLIRNAAIVTAVVFAVIAYGQSCAPSHSFKDGFTGLTSSSNNAQRFDIKGDEAGNESTPSPIFSSIPLTSMGINMDLEIFTELSFHQGKSIKAIIWDHQKDDQAICLQSFTDNPLWIELNCSTPGWLEISLYVVYTDSTSLNYIGRVEILADPTNPADPGTSPNPSPINGQALYATSCSGCHINSLGRFAKLSRTALDASIQKIPNMNSLSSLSDTERNAIINYLATQ
jgi:hypothetical protein